MTAREDTIERIERVLNLTHPKSITVTIPRLAAERAISLLKEQEAVVRCKDCKYWLPMNRFHQDYHPDRGDCELNCWVRDSDWFCADGERADEPEEKTKYYTVTHCPNCGRPFTENMVCECGQNNVAIRL